MRPNGLRRGLVAARQVDGASASTVGVGRVVGSVGGVCGHARTLVAVDPVEEGRDASVIAVAHLGIGRRSACSVAGLHAVVAELGVAGARQARRARASAGSRCAASATFAGVLSPSRSPASVSTGTDVAERSSAQYEPNRIRPATASGFSAAYEHARTPPSECPPTNQCVARGASASNAVERTRLEDREVQGRPHDDDGHARLGEPGELVGVGRGFDARAGEVDEPGRGRVGGREHDRLGRLGEGEAAVARGHRERTRLGDHRRRRPREEPGRDENDRRERDRENAPIVVSDSQSVTRRRRRGHRSRRGSGIDANSVATVVRAGRMPLGQRAGHELVVHLVHAVEVAARRAGTPAP